jgi:hypothetical protein
MKKLSIFLITFLLITGLSFTQEQYGNIRGVVMDVDGVPLAGVTVTLESERYASRSVITSEGGIFRFINVSLGICKVKCELPGFKTHIQENIDITVGFNVSLKIVMEIATLEEEVTVVAVSPLVDAKMTGTATHVTQLILQEIPSARDPWVILQQVPGLFIDRENVGGSESGQQSSFVSKGAARSHAMWNMDGIPITDMAALGASPTYYDFDQFDEMQIITSGQDASIQTGGVSINFIARRGSNKFQIMGRTFFTNDKLQSDNRTEELKKLGYVGNQINQIMDYGLQVGGPIIKDKFWFWVGYGVQDIRHMTIAGYPDNTILEGFNGKLNFQLSRRNRAELLFMLTSKTKEGRDSGPTRPPETTLNQSKLKFNPFIKFEDEHTFSPNFLLSLKLAVWPDGFKMVPQGGMDTQVGYDIGTGMYSGSYADYYTERDSYSAKLDGNYFVEDILGGNHEFKFGVEYRLFSVRTSSADPGDCIKGYMNGVPFMAQVSRDQVTDFKSDRYSFYINDAFTTGRLTFNLGFRMDREKAVNNETSVKASKTAPDLLPALTFPAIDPEVARLTFSPRIGFTFDLTGDGKTILRGNAARYGQHMHASLAKKVSPSRYSWAQYFWNDLDGNDQASTDELTGYPTSSILAFGGFDPWNPTVLESPNEIDKNLKSNLTDELILGIEREIFTDFSLRVDFILRRYHRLNWDVYYDKANDTKIIQSDYTGSFTGSLTYDGKTYNYEYWALAQYRPSGLITENRPDYHENYSCIEISAVKRLSHKWMMNVSFTYQIHTQHYGDNGYLDPTNIDMLDGTRAPYSTGFYYLSPGDWMAKLSFIYRLPWGFNISCFANARQGYFYAPVIRVSTPERAAVGLGSTTVIHIEKFGQTRRPDFYNADLSLVKEIRLGNYGTLSFQVDAFNIFNFAHDLKRYPQVNSTRYNEIEVILNPRVVRFGIRYRF